MAVSNHSVDMYPVHDVPATRPFIWLAEGWEGMLHHRGASLAYGVLVSLLGSLILAFDRHPLFIAIAVTAFLVVGPVITAGLCQLSRSRDHGDTSDFQSSLAALGSNRGHLVGFAEVLMLIAVLGFSAGALVLYAAGSPLAPTLASTVWGDVLRQLSTLQLTVYGVTLGSICLAVFLLSVVSVPMIIDRHVDAGTAMKMSLKVAASEPAAMAVWTVLILLLVAFGFGTGLLGMVLVMPLLGHATWYAYRDLVEEA